MTQQVAMDVRVHFRFNKLTGEVELFEVDQDSRLPEPEHEAEHDRLAAELGGLLASHPRIVEALGEGPESIPTPEAQEPVVEQEPPATEAPQRRRER